MKKMIILTLVSLAAFQGIASAKTLSGKIEAIDAAAKSISLADASGKVDVAVSDATAYAGARASNRS